MKRAQAILFTVAVMAAGCGGSDESDIVSAAPIIVENAASAATEPGADAPDQGGAELTDEEMALAFAQCMRSEGVDFPDPTVNADGSIDLVGAASSSLDPDSPTFENAIEECGDVLEGASFLPGAGLDEAEQQDRLLAFSECLRDLGYDVDDPDLSELQQRGPGAIATAFGDDFDPQDPANSDAVQQCQSIVLGGGTNG